MAWKVMPPALNDKSVPVRMTVNNGGQVFFLCRTGLPNNSAHYHRMTWNGRSFQESGLWEPYGIYDKPYESGQFEPMGQAAIFAWDKTVSKNAVGWRNLHFQLYNTNTGAVTYFRDLALEDVTHMNGNQFGLSADFTKQRAIVTISRFEYEVTGKGFLIDTETGGTYGEFDLPEATTGTYSIWEVPDSPAFVVGVGKTLRYYPTGGGAYYEILVPLSVRNARGAFDSRGKLHIVSGGGSTGMGMCVDLATETVKQIPHTLISLFNDPIPGTAGSIYVPHATNTAVSRYKYEYGMWNPWEDPIMDPRESDIMSAAFDPSTRTTYVLGRGPEMPDGAAGDFFFASIVLPNIDEEPFTTGVWEDIGKLAPISPKNEGTIVERGRNACVVETPYWRRIITLGAQAYVNRIATMTWFDLDTMESSTVALPAPFQAAAPIYAGMVSPSRMMVILAYTNSAIKETLFLDFDESEAPLITPAPAPQNYPITGADYVAYAHNESGDFAMVGARPSASGYSNAYRETEIFSGLTGAWSKDYPRYPGPGPSTETSYIGGAAVTYDADGNILILGSGSVSAGMQVWKLDLMTKTWAKVPTALPTAAAYSSAVCMPDGRIMLAGGSWDTSSTGRASPLVWAYDQDAGTFVMGPPLPVPLTQGRLVTDSNGDYYYVGGLTASSTTSAAGTVSDRVYRLRGFGTPRPVKPRAFGSIRIRGSVNVATRSTVKADGKASVRLIAAGRATVIFSAAIISRRAPIAPRRFEAAWNRQIVDVFVERLTTKFDEAPRLDTRIGNLPMKMATSFHASRQWEGRWRPGIRFGLKAADGNYVIMPVEFDVTGPRDGLHTHVAGFSMRVQFGIKADASLTYQVGEAVLQVIDVGLWGWFPGRTLPLGDILPPGETRLRMVMRVNFPDGIVAAQGEAEPLALNVGMESEPRVPIAGEVAELPIALKDGVYRWAQWFWDGVYYPYRYWVSDWIGIVDPAGHSRALGVDVGASLAGVQTQFGEVEPGAITLGMTASHYPYGASQIGMRLTMPPSRAKVTFYGRAKPNVRLDYINFTGKNNSEGVLRREMLIWLEMSAGDLEDAILGEAARMRVKLRVGWSGYVIRVIHPRPVLIVTAAYTPTVIHHSVRSEGI